MRLSAGREHLVRGAHLHQLAQQEEGRLIADTRGLLHVVGDDDDGVILFQLRGQLLDLGRRDGVQGAGRLIHQQDLGLNGQGARNAEALLLAARHAQGALVQAVLDLVPDGRAAQGSFHDLIQLRFIADTVGARAVGDVVVDGHGEGVRLLEHHADAAAQDGDLHLVLVDVHAVEPDIARDAAARHKVVHAVQGLQKGGLAAAGGADERGDLPLAHVQRDTFQRLEVAVPEVQVFCRYHRHIRVFHRVPHC